MKEEFNLEILYAQVAAFDSGLDRPYNRWTKPHLQQGFCWRERSVSFALPDDELIQATLRIGEERALPQKAIRIIRVPFRSQSGVMEIGSVIATRKFRVGVGKLDLYFSLLVPPSEKYVAAVDVSVEPSRYADAAILRRDGLLFPADVLLMAADPA